jgi:hypothetical protein
MTPRLAATMGIVAIVTAAVITTALSALLRDAHADFAMKAKGMA